MSEISQPQAETVHYERPAGFDIVERAKHYNTHPSGVECIEINEHMTANLAAAFKYGWRYYEKGDPVENLRKMLWYVRRSFQHDASFLFSPEHAAYFRQDVMTPQRRRIFDRPSPWCEPVRHAMAGICDLHSGANVAERIRIYDKIIKCLGTAIDDEQCMGRAFEP
jgi:hypothetical protein